MLALDLLFQKLEQRNVQSKKRRKDIMYMIAELITTVTCITIGAMVTLFRIWPDRTGESQSRGNRTHSLSNLIPFSHKQDSEAVRPKKVA